MSFLETTTRQVAFVTVYMREDQLPAMDDYEVSHGRTYRYLKDRPLYPFGHGESYTRFTYRDLVVVPSKKQLEVALTITNSGDRMVMKWLSSMVLDLNRRMVRHYGN